jgi:hypothetical protein
MSSSFLGAALGGPLRAFRKQKEPPPHQLVREELETGSGGCLFPLPRDAFEGARRVREKKELVS